MRKDKPSKISFRASDVDWEAIQELNELKPHYTLAMMIRDGLQELLKKSREEAKEKK